MLSILISRRFCLIIQREKEQERERERLEFVLTCFELHDIVLRTLPKINWLKVLSPIEQSQS